MKKSFFIIAAATLIISCKNNAQSVTTEGYKSFGKLITTDKAIETAAIGEQYKTLKIGDTINVKFKSTIQDVCQNKGCWMKLDVAEKEQSFVKFKDYAFFMPKDSKGQEVIVNGKAFVSEISVDEQKHYAEDKGESKAVIDAIVAPKLTYSFLADGVLLKSKK